MQSAFYEYVKKRKGLRGSGLKAIIFHYNAFRYTCTIIPVYFVICRVINNNNSNNNNNNNRLLHAK